VVTDVQLTFMVEPFVGGRPGPHVGAAIRAVESAGLTVEMGPFDNLAAGNVEDMARAVAALVRGAFANGATRLSIQLTSQEAKR
jgi:uncharacterized protein YqgV (UPF0045/DUF77 family)